MKKSRIETKVTPNPNGGVDVSCKCKCGKPIVQSNKWGMYCEDKCGQDEDKLAYLKIKAMFGGLL